MDGSRSGSLGSKRAKRAAHTGVVAVLLGACAATGCARNAATGKRQLNFVSQSQQLNMGKQAAAEVAQTMGLYDNAGLQSFVDTIGKRLAAVSERPKLPWTFKVVDDPAVNAFALPGGYIFLTRGILAYLDNEAQLAAVLGHEIGHVTAEHSANQMSKAQLGQLGLGLGMIVSDTVRQLGQLGSAGLQLAFLKFGRDDENQADMLGMRYAVRAAYDIREMPEVFQILKSVSDAAGSGGRTPTWLATHPDPAARVEKTKERLAKLDLSQTRMMIDREDYLQKIDGLVYGENPRNGFFEQDRFYQPDLRFTMTVPSGWKHQNTPQAVVAASPAGDAAFQLTIAPARTPDEAMAALARQQGIQLAQTGAAQAGGGLTSRSAAFQATTQQGAIQGLVTFVAHGGKTYQLVSMTTPAKLSSYAPLMQQAHASFAPLTDARVLGVQPARLQIERAPRAMTLAELYRERPAPVSLEELGRLNQMTAASPLTAGQQIKWVRGGTKSAGGAAPAGAGGAPPPPPSPPTGGTTTPAAGAPPPPPPQ